MKSLRKSLTFLSSVVTTAVLTTQLVAAQGYPNRPVRVIVAYPAGQSTDTATRYLANKLSLALGQNFVVDNRPGAFGNIGTALAAKAPNDGYTLVMAASGTHAINPGLYENTGFDADKDFDPIILTAIIPMVVSVHPSLNVNSLPELIQLAKSRPDKIDVAVPSVTAQLVLEMFKQRDVPLFAVKYKGSADAMTAVLGGQVPVLIDTVVATRPQLGKLKALAVTTTKEMSALPNVKSAVEQGMTGFSVTAWNALMAPRGTPVDIQEKLASEMRKILALPETIKALHDLGFEAPPSMSQPELVEWARAERRKYAEIIKTARMKPE